MSIFLNFIIAVKPFFYQLIYMSILGSILGIGIVCIRTLFKKFISPKWIMNFWLIFLLALIVPISLKSNLSIYNYLPIKIENYYKENSIIEQENESNIVNNNRQIIGNNNEKDVLKHLIVTHLLTLIWLLASISSFIIYLFVYLFTKYKVKKSHIPTKDKLKSILEKVKKQMEIKTNVNIVMQDFIKMPTLFGTIKPSILLYSNSTNISNKEYEYIIMHELAHLKRKDNYTNLLVSVLSFVYFFNPIILKLFNELKIDMEIATDELVLNQKDSDIKKEYCHTLINISTEGYDKFYIRSVSINDSKKTLDKRIAAVRDFKRFESNRALSVFSIVILVCVSIIFGTKSVNYYSREDVIKILENCSLSIESNYNYSYTYIQNNNILEKESETREIKEKNEINNQYIGLLNNLAYEYKYIGIEKENDQEIIKCELISKSTNSNIIGETYFYIDKETGRILKVEMNDFTELENIYNISVFEYKYN